MWYHFRVTADQQHFFALLGHHVAQISEREAFAYAAFAINGDNLGAFGTIS